jgi:hypothetical protein
VLIRSLAALRSGAWLLALLVVLSAGGPVLAGSSEAAAAIPAVCRGPVLQREADAAAIDRHDPDRTLVSIGATAEGIGAVYALARSRGFSTLGIVSSLAREKALRKGEAKPTSFRGEAEGAPTAE